MAIIDKIIKDLCDRLGRRGWQKLLLEVTGGELNILQRDAVALVEELNKQLSTIQRE